MESINVVPKKFQSDELDVSLDCDRIMRYLSLTLHYLDINSQDSRETAQIYLNNLEDTIDEFIDCFNLNTYFNKLAKFQSGAMPKTKERKFYYKLNKWRISGVLKIMDDIHYSPIRQKKTTDNLKESVR